MRLREPVALVAPLRSPIGKVGGVLSTVEPHRLLAHIFQNVLAYAVMGSVRTTERLQAAAAEAIREAGSAGPEEIVRRLLGGGGGLASVAGASVEEVLEFESRIDDVVVGNLRNSIGNIARVAALEAGLSVTIPAQTVDRQCASSMEALAIAAAKITSGMARCLLVGGVESASRAPWLFEKADKAYGAEPRAYRVRMSTDEIGDPPMGETAEALADRYDISREEMDAFALESHRRAASAQEKGAFAEEIVPVPVPQRKGEPLRIDRDECVRADTSPAALGRLAPAFRKDGRVTAGNSSPINDGAAACLAVSRGAVEEWGLTPFAWLTGVATVGLHPKTMGMGPAEAIPRLLREQQVSSESIDLYEINEAFAAQVIAVNRELRIPPEKLNVCGGALALGHPLGATGLRLVVTLAHALRSRGLRRGIASLCVGGGQGMAVLVETTLEN